MDRSLPPYAEANTAPAPQRQSVLGPTIDAPEDAVMVTPLELLQKSPANIDCLFCQKMTRTKVREQVDEESPSGYVLSSFPFSSRQPALTADSLMVCLICLVCCPLLLCLPAFSTKTYRWFHNCDNCNAVVAIKSQDGSIDVKKPQPSKLVPTRFGAARESNQNVPTAANV